MAYRQVHKDASGKISKVTWVAEAEIEGQRFRRRGLLSRSEAERQERRWRSGPTAEDVEQFTPSKPENPNTLLKVAKRHAKSLWPNSEWRKLMEYALARIAKQLDSEGGDPALEAITKASLKDVSQSMITLGLSPVSVRKYFCAVNLVMKAAEDEGLIKSVPTIPWPKGTKVKVRWLKGEEEAKLLGILHKWGETNPQASEVADFLEISIATAMRRSELMTLDPDQLDYPWVRLWSTKTGKPRAVPLPDREMFDLLQKRVPWKITNDTLRYWWAKVKKEMGLSRDKELTPHVTRHTAATRVYERTGDLKLVQGLLGHAKVATTADVYTHLGDPKLLDAAQKLVDTMARSKKPKQDHPACHSDGETPQNGDVPPSAAHSAAPAAP